MPVSFQVNAFMPPLVIPIFISHQGCPHRCIFCDQHAITGHAGPGSSPVNPASVKQIVEHWLSLPRKENKDSVQVAFYGGSFTGLPRQLQGELLTSIQPFIKAGQVDNIRISTRPDYIDGDTVCLLKEYSVTIVELGIQSLDQEVLAISKRGHSAAQAENGIRLLKQHGFTVGAQLMCGLPGDSTLKVLATAKKVANLAPDFVRIYPALVIRGSGLERLYRDGNYRPLSLFRAVVLSSRMKEIFDQQKIRVVRMGLQPSEELAAKLVAGPYHPAFGELVMARMLFRQTRKLLHEHGHVRGKRLSISDSDQSAFRGPYNTSVKKLSALGLLENVEIIFDKDQSRNTVRIC